MSFNHAMLFLESACGFGKLINDPAGTKRVDLNAGKKTETRGEETMREMAGREGERDGERDGERREKETIQSHRHACVCE